MRTTVKTAILPLLLTSLLVTAGCASKRVAPMQKDVNSTNEEISKRLREIDRSGAKAKSAVDNAEGIWLPVRKIRENELQVAGHKATSRRFSVNREFRTIQDVAERVTLLMGIPVTVAPEALPAAQAGQAATGAAPAAGPTAGAMPGMMPGMGFAMGATGGSNANNVPLSYDGPLSGFLDVAAARFGVSWEWAGDGIRFYRYTTRTFRLAALPGETVLQNMVSNTTGGTSTGGGGAGNSAASETKQKTQVDSKLSVWSAIGDSIKGMLSDKGTVTVTAATGTVTVTDRPEVVDLVEKFIEQQNASLTKQVVVNVRVLSVELNNAEQYGINWGLAYQSMSGNLGFKFSNAFIDPSTASGSSLALNVLSSAGQNTNADIRSWAGSQALVNALSSQGHVSQVTSASLTTLNNQSAPLQVGRQTTYLASSTTTVTQGAGSTTTLQPGLLTTGFSMTIVPHILEKGKLMLQYAIDISSLLRMYTVNSNNSSIQAPDVDTRNFLQRVMLNTGDTLVMTGFEQSTLNATTEGMGNANNTMLGGGVNGKRNRSVLVILIQPVVAD